MSLRKALRKVTGGLRKVAKSPLGKIALAGAAMWAGGQIFGRMAAGGAAAGNAAAPALAGAAPSAAPALAQAAPAAESAVTAAAAPANSGGIISRAIKGIGGFVEKNPMASSMMFNAVSSAMAPDEMEMMEEQERLRRKRFQDMRVPGSLGFKPNKGIINGGMQ